MDLPLRARLTRAAHLYKALFRQHHRELLPAFAAVLDGQAITIEAGGHAGQFTKLLAGLTPHGRVLTFEPSSYACSILEQVVRRRTRGRAKAYRAALGSREETVELHVPIKQSGSVRFGLSHVARQTGDRAFDTPILSERVRQTTVDAVVAVEGLQRLDLLKADIEGGELQMLKGATRALERFRPTLFLEVNDGHLRRAGDSAAALWRLVEGLGYRGFFFDVPTGRFLPAPSLADGDLWFLLPDRISKLPYNPDTSSSVSR